MEPEEKWIVTRVDGKISSISVDYRHFALVADCIAEQPAESVSEISTEKISRKDLAALSLTTKWEDLRLFGTAFQIKVWRQLYLLSHRSDGMPRLPEDGIRLLSYSELAKICGNLPGVRAVAHAVAQNPVAYVIPCHLIVPKESVDKILSIRSKAQGIDSIDVGDYEYGTGLKRRLIETQLYNH